MRRPGETSAVSAFEELAVVALTAEVTSAEDVILLREIRDLLEGNRDRDAAREGGSHSA